jgi:hypothetical protein
VITSWPAPSAGDIVWCFYPTPKPKFRPVLILAVFDDNAPDFEVRVTYGTSQKTDQLFAGEFVIQKSASKDAFEAAGLSYDTKFNLKRTVLLTYDNEFFKPPPSSKLGHTPKLGILHPSMMQALQAAYRAVSN